MKKRFLGIFMAVAMIVTSLPVMAFADVEEAPVDESQVLTSTETTEEATVVEDVVGEQPEESPVVEAKHIKPVANTGLVYNTDDQQLIKSAGSAKCFQLEGHSKHNHISSIKAEEAGTYTVYYWYNENGYGRADGTLEVTIAKCPIKVTLTANAKWANEHGKKQLISKVDKEVPDYLHGKKVKVTLDTHQHGDDKGEPKDWVDWDDLKVTEAGKYTVYYTIEDLDTDNYEAYGIQYVSVGEFAKANEGLVYTGEAQQLLKEGQAAHFWVKRSTWHEYDSAEEVVATDAGTYEVYYGKHFTTAKKVTVTIEQAPLTVVWDNTELVYNGHHQKPTAQLVNVANDYAVDVYVTGSQKEAGKYKGKDQAKVVLYGAKYDSKNYYVAAEGRGNHYKTNFEIKKAPLTLKWGETEFTYNGAKQKPTAVLYNETTGYEVPVLVKGSKVNAGHNYKAEALVEYVSHWAYDSHNYEIVKESKHYKYSTTFDIHRAPLAIEWTDKEFTYDGEYHVPTATATYELADGTVYTVELKVKGRQKDAGTYTYHRFGKDERAYVDVKASHFDKKNYEINDDADTEETFVIKKAVVTVAAQDAEKTFGYEDPEFEYVATGFVEKEDAKMQEYLKDVIRVERSRLITDEEAVGTYENCIKLRWTEHEHYYAKQLEALNKNYEFEFVRADFTINDVVITAGAGQKYTQGTKGGVTFKYDGIDSEVEKVLVDGVEVDASNYTVEHGSTILTLKEEYLKTLKAGVHKLSVVYVYGDDTTTVDTEFTIAASPNTADTNDMAPFAVLLMISIMGLAGVSLKRN